jgi:hypothetical protein
MTRRKQLWQIHGDCAYSDYIKNTALQNRLLSSGKALQEVIGSNVSRDTQRPCWGFPWLSSVPHEIAWTAPQLRDHRLLSNSFQFICHLTFRRFTDYDTHSHVKWPTMQEISHEFQFCSIHQLPSTWSRRTQGGTWRYLRKYAKTSYGGT